MSIRRSRFALVLAATAVLLAGCGDAPAPSSIEATAVAPPLPGAEAITSAPTAEGTGSCDTEATLAPRAQPRPGAMPAGSAMAAIVANGRLRVGVDQNTYMFGFRNPSTGRLEGFDIDLAREIARDLFGDPDRIELRSVTAADRIQLLQERKVDMIVRTFSATCERRRDVDFSSVYYRAAQRFAAPRGAGIASGADLAGKRVCVTKGTTAAAPLFTLPTPPTVLGVTNWTDCLVALQQGTVDAISGDEPILSGLVAQDRNLELVGAPIGSGAYAVGVPKGSDELVRFVNGVLERTSSDGTWERIYAQHLSALGPSPGAPAPRYAG
ncbi:glutamate ABC transporter substrate-binding protein [Nocardia ignorata]|uniref:Amino acid ABC transporter substrate-binding protein (PAAT family) n=1 Tax=Nocardia ignorata TaxID=145285 RepID=A0A4R6PSD3_NOCIG|nr:glutamate ABC transporter substrate-binding protein [Nocardia ignorata]TDP40910.1 amino acid ABC transporter substrate-binding protein (PAAT family) [Nocardia ignorata]